MSVWEVIGAASTKPYGFIAFTPGLVGGHCIPVDPYYLAWKAREYDFHMDFIDLAARVNDEMPFYIVNRILAALYDRSIPPGGHLLILGVAFKKDVDDVRHSPALKVIELLLHHQFDVQYHDPYIQEVRVNGRVLRSIPLTAERLANPDCVVVLTDHSCIDYFEVVRHARLVFDARNATSPVSSSREKVILL